MFGFEKTQRNDIIKANLHLVLQPIELNVKHYGLRKGFVLYL